MECLANYCIFMIFERFLTFAYLLHFHQVKVASEVVK